MPFYDYACDKCNSVVEKFHGMSESPKYHCDICGEEMRRAYINAPAMKIGTTLAIERAINKSKRRCDMQTDLRENYGVEKVQLLPNSSGFEGTYKEIKQMGSFVVDRMQQTKEENRKKTEAKQKNRKLSESEKQRRINILKEKRASQDFANRSISMQTKISK